MPVLRTVITEGRAGILRSARLPQPTAAVVEVQGLVLLLQVLAAAAVASVLKVQLTQPRQRTGQAVAEMALPSQPATRLAVLVVVLEQALLQLHRLPYTRATEAWVVQPVVV